MKTAAIYARVSSEKQKEENTIASQTAALVAFAAEQGYAVPSEWVFEDEGYSGASLIRPGLERVRDLAAEGHLDAVLLYAPDRLSRRYAYQILLIEEFARAGVETLFIRSPRTATAEDQLLLQFQGMIAEYERAQILERSRRGKRHRARQGQVSVLSGAPFGYRYVRKSEQSAAYYEIDEAEAPVVRLVYERYTNDGLSIGAIAVFSTTSRSRRASKPAVGNVRRSGQCCVTPPIKAPLALARRKVRRGSASPGRYACAAA
jgi:site-specific DNA recombinase